MIGLNVLPRGFQLRKQALRIARRIQVCDRIALRNLGILLRHIFHAHYGVRFEHALIANGIFCSNAEDHRNTVASVLLPPVIARTRKNTPTSISSRNT